MKRTIDKDNKGQHKRSSIQKRFSNYSNTPDVQDDHITPHPQTKSEQRLICMTIKSCMFLERIKAEFPNDESVFHEFLNIMNDYVQRNIQFKQFTTRASKLFQGKTELIQELTAFLPPGKSMEKSVSKHTKK